MHLQRYLMFKPVTSQTNLVELEESLLKYWKEHKIFEKSVEMRPLDKQWTFLDGPPFITGMPHYGTLLPSILKDVYPRYWTMKGYRVRRVWGWDCHGLPAENKVENKLGLKRKKDIEEVVGIKKFIDECKLYVNEVSSEWQWYIDHIARWVDFEHAYKTMDKDYMESVMWVFKQMYEKGHIYKGMRISLYCPHCVTPISNFEVAMDADNYKDITEPANTYKYKLVGEENTYFLAWSTTPWTKITTMALAVNPQLEYVKVQQNNEYYILAKSTLKSLIGEYKVVAEMLGQDLLGKQYEPHYDFTPREAGKKVFEIIPGDFVTAEDGTGIVTIAAYGEDDLVAMKANNIQIVLHVDEEGKFLPQVPNWGGQYYLKANPLINEDLTNRGLMYKEEPHTHSVPHCWRCHTRLIYSPQNAWYVNVQDLKTKLEQTNESVNWYPDHFKHGRFLNSMKSAPDWCISRSRYWGSPVPVWECDCGWRFVPGSIAEISEKSKTNVTELHKPEIDEITVVCDKCQKTVHRVPEVLDSWIEAGSASFAERHYPFDTSHKLSDFFPPDFIVEYTGQIRAWFYVLHVIAGAIYDSHAFKNVAVTGVIMGTDGKKMSKNLGNYPDPKTVIQKYGGDALRLYLAGNSVTRGEDMSISEEDYKLQVRGTLLILWNCYNFFITYANIDKFDKTNITLSTNPLDQWITALLVQTHSDVTAALERYDSVEAVSKIVKFIDEFSTWYIRRSRDRVGPTATNAQDKQDFYSTCYTVLRDFCLLSAPIIPFITDEIYQNLTGEESVHLANWKPVINLDSTQIQLLSDMKQIRKIVENGLAVRKAVNIKVRQPLKSATVDCEGYSDLLTQLIKDELNVKSVKYIKNNGTHSVELDTNIDEELLSEGKLRDLIREIQQLRKVENAGLDQYIDLVIPGEISASHLDQLKVQVLAKNISVGDSLSIKLV